MNLQLTSVSLSAVRPQKFQREESSFPAATAESEISKAAQTGGKGGESYDRLVETRRSSQQLSSPSFCSPP